MTLEDYLKVFPKRINIFGLYKRIKKEDNRIVDDPIFPTFTNDNWSEVIDYLDCSVLETKVALFDDDKSSSGKITKLIVILDALNDFEDNH